MTLSSSLSDVLRSGGDFVLVRRLWSHFCVALGKREPEFKLNWSRSETLVSCSFVRFIITSDFDGLFDSCYCIVVFFFFFFFKFFIRFFCSRPCCVRVSLRTWYVLHLLVLLVIKAIVCSSRKTILVSDVTSSSGRMAT